MTRYWQRAVERRLTRRRALIATGAGAAGAALLAACGGDDDGASATPKDRSGLLWQPVDESKGARTGGTFVTVQGNALVTHDVHRIGAHGGISGRGYSQLFRISDGVLQQTTGTPQGDLAESWELSPDKLQLTIKLDPGAGFAPLPPVSGRVVDADDVLFSWERFKSVGTLRGDIANELSSGAPVVSITAPDKRTIVVKIAEPNSAIFTLLGLGGLGTLFIVPKEAADTSKLDIARQPLGSGPFYITDSNEVNIRYKRNPNFKRASLKSNEPWLDEVFTPVIPNIATASAQFRSGQVHDYALPALEVVGAKRENNSLLMYAADPITTERWYFGQNPDSPFRDERLRIAYHKVIDRDLYVTAAYNTDNYKKEGLPVQEFWEGSFGVNTWTGYVLDPKSEKDHGAATKNFKFDLAEAKRLVEAAGHKTPFEYVQVYSDETPTSFAPPIYRRVDIVMNMIEESGVFKMRRRPLEWATEWSPQIRQGKGNFNGASWGPDTSSLDPTRDAFFIYNPKGGYYEGGDATLEDLTIKAVREFDERKRQEIIKEIQRYDATKMFNQKVGSAGGFRVVWPAVRNTNVFRGGTNWTNVRLFLDPSQAPLRRS